MTTTRVTKTNTDGRGPMVNGVPLYPPVREGVDVVSTSNVTVSTLATGSTIDGVTLAGGERVLLAAQTTASENGIYAVGLSAGLTYRCEDWCRQSPPAQGTLVTVLKGAVWAGTVWSVYSTDTDLYPTIIPDFFDPIVRPVDPGKYLMPSGAWHESYDRTSGTTVNMAAALVSGTLMLWGFPAVAGRKLETVTFVSGTTALDTGTVQQAVVCDSSRVGLAVSVDRTSSAWAADTAKTFTFTSGYTFVTSGFFYIGLLVVASTVPSLVGNSDAKQGAAAIAPIIAGSSTTGLSAALSIPFTGSALTTKGQKPYFYLT